MRASFFLTILGVVFILALPTLAISADNNIEATVGGQLKLSFFGTDFRNDSIHSEYKDDTWFDAGSNLRIKSRVFFNDNLSFDCHYLFTSSIGDSMESAEYFSENYPGTLIAQLFQRKFDDDTTKALDLSSKIRDEDNYFLYYRLDRFNLSLEGSLGRITIGRQAVTWGNGLVFNPMDVFNPFSPYDTERDYKKGDDMVYVETFFEKGDDLQFLYVPRRDLEDKNIKFSKSSIGAKYHLLLNDMEFDFMIARHYEDALAGIGCVSTIGNAVWRGDLIYTFAGGDMEDDFLSLVINIDYSWAWFKKNFYGLIEYYYSGLGADGNYSEVYTDYDLSTRISRGEIYGFGKNYLSSSISIELSPLLNFNFTAIANLSDPSYLIQPGITWNAAQNFEIAIGANFAIGGKDDEYGQVGIPLSTKKMDYSSNLFLWVTMFF
ncbi:MAG: hypothetical protein KAJ62_04390 [Desulfobacteraceae bacterium]|nr:hypothetical protein [Desulfobacteraceae bacterium]